MVRVHLTAKQLRFCAEYLIDLNATQAAIRAGYSQKTARIQGAQMLDRSQVQAEINWLKVARSKRVNIDSAWVLRKLAANAEASLGDFLVRPADGGTPYYDLRNATPEQLNCLEALQIDSYVEGKGEDAQEVKRIKLTLPNRLKALELIGKHVKVQAFNEQIEVTATMGLVERIQAGRKRAGMPRR